MKFVYLSGPITGIPDENRPAFKEAENKLISKGYRVANPSYISDRVRNKIKNPTWCNFMREALKVELKCDAIYFLPDWRKSKGARIEHFIATVLKMEIIKDEE